MSAYGKGRVSVLRDETYRRFNYFPESLPQGSHKKLVVSCKRCGEEFTREFRFLSQLHACPVRKARSDGKELKWCNRCKEWVTIDCFSKNRARTDGLCSICDPCRAETPRLRKSPPRKTLIGWIRHMCSGKKSKCFKHRIPFGITSEGLLQQWHTQNGRCYYSNAPMDYGINALHGASLERLNSAAGYVAGNVVWASKAMNWCKNIYSVDEFYKFFTSFNSPVRIECKLLHPDAIVPFRKRTTDAGYDISSIEDVVVAPSQIISVETGLAFTAPPGWYMTIEGRSSLGLKGIVPFRGIVDATYNGHLKVVLTNYSTTPYTIKKGDRIAQLILHKQNHMDVSMVEVFSPEYSDRKDAGFGSSGA